MRPTMAARVEGMVRPQRGAELLDGLIVVFLGGMFSGIGLAFVVRANQTIVPQVLRAATSAALGVLTGLTARRALRGRSGGRRGGRRASPPAGAGREAGAGRAAAAPSNPAVFLGVAAQRAPPPRPPD